MVKQRTKVGLTDEQIQTRMAAEVDFRVPGCALVMLLDILLERGRALTMAEKLAALTGRTDDTAEAELRATEVIGVMVMEAVAKTFNREFLDAYISGKIDLPEPPQVAPSTATVN